MPASLKYLWKNQYNGIIRIGLHIGFWFIVVFFYYLLFSWKDSNREITLIISAGLLPLAILISYFFNYKLVPNFLWRKKYARFFLYSLYTFLFSVWCSFLIILFVLIFGLNKYEYIEPRILHPELQVITLHFIIFLAIAIKQIKRVYEIQQEKNEIYKQNITTELKLKEAELKLLKMQIQPHFLFNTLNNLYGLTLEKSEKAPELVLHLSEILDYILYRCNEKLVSVGEEIHHLKNYIEIEKIRYSEKLELFTDIPEINDNLKIAPLLLIPFIENAFKHGASNNPGKSTIKVQLKYEEPKLFLSIYNTKNKKKTITNGSHGIGLNNVSKRLDLIYKEKYELRIDETESDYCINLNIDIKN